MSTPSSDAPFNALKFWAASNVFEFCSFNGAGYFLLFMAAVSRHHLDGMPTVLLLWRPASVDGACAVLA